MSRPFLAASLSRLYPMNQHPARRQIIYLAGASETATGANTARIAGGISIQTLDIACHLVMLSTLPSLTPRSGYAWAQHPCKASCQPHSTPAPPPPAEHHHHLLSGYLQPAPPWPLTQSNWTRAAARAASASCRPPAWACFAAGVMPSISTPDVCHILPSSRCLSSLSIPR